MTYPPNPSGQPGQPGATPNPYAPPASPYAPPSAPAGPAPAPYTPAGHPYAQPSAQPPVAGSPYGSPYGDPRSAYATPVAPVPQPQAPAQAAMPNIIITQQHGGVQQGGGMPVAYQGESSGLGIAALICSFFCCGIGLILGIIAVTTAGTNQKQKQLGWWAIGISAATTLIAVLYWIFAIALVASSNSNY